MNGLDRLISYFAPEAGLSRQRARVRLGALATTRNHFDGATGGRRGANLPAYRSDANEASRSGLGRLRFRARHMVRNNPLAMSALRVIKSNVVGAGIVPHFIDADGNPDDALEELARAHLDTTACDADGRHDYYGLQALIVGTAVEAGEALVLRRRPTAAMGLPVPLQFQVLEPDYLDDTKHGPGPDGTRYVQGIELDAAGRRAAYWMYPAHPGALWSSTQSIRVPASEVLHVFRVDRPGQQRGVSWFTPIMLTLDDLTSYQDAQLVRQKIAASYAAFITNVDDGDGTHAQIENNPTSGDREMALEPGAIEELGYGESIVFSDPPEVGGFAEVRSAAVHDIAAGLGITHESLSTDMKGVSFISGRLGRLEMDRNVDAWQQLMMIPSACDPMMAWWLESALLAGATTDGISVVHAPPVRPMVDPRSEVPPLIKAVRAGVTSLSSVVRSRGLDPKRHFEEMAADNAELDRLGLVLDSDPRRTTTAGSSNGTASSTSVEPEPEDQSSSEDDAEAADDDEPEDEEEQE